MSMTMAYTYAMAYDPANHRLIFAGLEGAIRFLDLRMGQDGSLLEIPGHPAILDMSLNTNNWCFAACVSRPSLNAAKKKPALVHVWDCDKLD